MMSQKDGILSIICAQRGPNEDLSEGGRALIVREVEIGMSYRDVARENRCSPGTVFNIYQREIT
jgi:hypothetical protein